VICAELPSAETAAGGSAVRKFCLLAKGFLQKVSSDVHWYLEKLTSVMLAVNIKCGVGLPFGSFQTFIHGNDELGTKGLGNTRCAV
jgi:hypothetical protein